VHTFVRTSYIYATYVYKHIRAYVHKYEIHLYTSMGWLQLVGSIKL